MRHCGQVVYCHNSQPTSIAPTLWPQKPADHSKRCLCLQNKRGIYSWVNRLSQQLLNNIVQSQTHCLALI